jgi:hypothetical protein
MEKEKREKDKKTREENISEIFEVEKEGKTEVIEVHGVEESKQEVVEEKAPSESQIKKEKKIFMNVIFVMLGLVLVFLATYLLIHYTRNFEYRGIRFYIDKEDLIGITLYKTSLPITIENGTKGNYNFYLRKDPRTLKDVTFDGNLTIKKDVVINMTNNFNCDGNGIIAIANLVNLYSIMAANVIRDENATCDPEGRYMFLRIEDGNATKIEQFGPSCYKMYINDCEILEGTEKFMIETFSEINKVTKG